METPPLKEMEVVSTTERVSLDFPPPTAFRPDPTPHVRSLSAPGRRVHATQAAWPLPPLPPIPPEQPDGAWRRRSLKRTSYASQMSNYSTAQSPAVEVEKRRMSQTSNVSIPYSAKSTPSHNFSHPSRRKQGPSPSARLEQEAAKDRPINWSPAKKWFHVFAS